MCSDLWFWRVAEVSQLAVSDDGKVRCQLCRRIVMNGKRSEAWIHHESWCPVQILKDAIEANAGILGAV